MTVPRRVVALRVAVGVAFLLGWELAARAGAINPEWFSVPSVVVIRLGHEVGQGTFVVHAGVTLVEVLGGFAAGVVGGVALGIVLARLDRVRNVLMPYLVAIYGIPRPAMAPLFVLWFGIGLLSKVVLIVSLVYFVLVLYVLTGAGQVNADLLRLAATTGATPGQTLRKIVIPSVLPWVFAGMKLGLGLAIIGAVVGEMISSEAGVGYYIVQAAYRGDTQGIYVGLAALAIMSWAFVAPMERLERRLFHWRRETTF